MSKLFIKDRFATTPNTILYNSKITLRAKGLFAFIQGKPDRWSFSAERIAFENKEGVQSVRSALRELEEFGFLSRVKTKNEKGHWETNYILSSETKNPVDEIPTLGNQPTETHSAENPTSGNPTLENHTNNNNTDIRKKDINNTIESKIEYSLFPDGWFSIWQEWLQYKKTIKKPYRTDKSENAAFRKLIELSDNNSEIAQNIIRQSIENDWVGFFELKNNNVSNKKGVILNFD